MPDQHMLSDRDRRDMPRFRGRADQRARIPHARMLVRTGRAASSTIARSPIDANMSSNDAKSIFDPSILADPFPRLRVTSVDGVYPDPIGASEFTLSPLEGVRLFYPLSFSKLSTFNF